MSYANPLFKRRHFDYLVDHTREELSVSRSTANDMAEAVKALKSISTDFNQAVVSTRAPRFI